MPSVGNAVSFRFVLGDVELSLLEIAGGAFDNNAAVLLYPSIASAKLDER